MYVEGYMRVAQGDYRFTDCDGLKLSQVGDAKLTLEVISFPQSTWSVHRGVIGVILLYW